MKRNDCGDCNDRASTDMRCFICESGSEFSRRRSFILVKRNLVGRWSSPFPPLDWFLDNFIPKETSRLKAIGKYVDVTRRPFETNGSYRARIEKTMSVVGRYQ